jgi:hypothetical protein
MISPIFGVNNPIVDRRDFFVKFADFSANSAVKSLINPHEK